MITIPKLHLFRLVKYFNLPRLNWPVITFPIKWPFRGYCMPDWQNHFTTIGINMIKMDMLGMVYDMYIVYELVAYSQLDYLGESEMEYTSQMTILRGIMMIIHWISGYCRFRQTQIEPSSSDTWMWDSANFINHPHNRHSCGWDWIHPQMLGLLLGFPHPSDFVCVLYLYIYIHIILALPKSLAMS